MFSRLQTEMYTITLIEVELQLLMILLPGKVMTEEGYKNRLGGHKCNVESEQDAVEARSRKWFQKKEFMGDRSTQHSWMNSSLRKPQIANFLGSGRMP